MQLIKVLHLIVMLKMILDLETVRQGQNNVEVQEVANNNTNVETNNDSDESENIGDSFQPDIFDPNIGIH